MDDQEALLDLIYESAFLPSGWSTVLDSVAAEGDATAGIMFLAGPHFSGWQASAGLRQTAQSFVDDGWVLTNSRTPLLIARNQMGFVRDSDVFTDEALAVEPMQVGLLLPGGFGREVATMLPMPTGETIVFSLNRPFASGPYDDAAVRRLDALRPHIARASLMAARLRLAQMRTAVDMLDAVGLPAAVLGPDAIVLASNNLLDQAPHIQCLAFSRLGVQPAQAQRRLAEAMTRLDRTADVGLLSLLLTSHGNAPDAVLHIVPLRREARDLMTGAIAVAVVTMVQHQMLPSADLLHGLFDLTAAEAKVARGLMSQSVSQFAASASLSVETIRTQLKSVLHKTGTERQATLLTLLTRISAIGGEPVVV